MLPGESLSIPDARVMLITQQRIPVPDSQDRDCVKIAGMALVYAQPVRPAADVPMEREWRTIRPGVPVWRTSTISLFCGGKVC